MKSTSTRTYTIPKKNFLLHCGRGMSVGGEFQDHGRTMRVTAVGQVYRDGRERLINITAVEIDENSEKTEPSTKSPTAL